MGMSIHTAKRKDHRCSVCGRRIPLGARYWSDETGDRREHTNCLEYEDQERLPDGYNKLRPKPSARILRRKE